MLLLSELRRDWKQDVTSLKARAIIIVLIIVGCGPVAQAQQIPAGDFIVLDGGIKPETVSLSLQESCFATKFRFVIVNRPHGSFLVEARRGGRSPRHPEAVAAVKHFLMGVRNVRFRGTKCVSADEIKIALDGLLKSPPGKSNQVSQLFTIRF